MTLHDHIDKLLAMPGLTPEARTLLYAAKIAEDSKTLPSEKRLQEMLNANTDSPRCNTSVPFCKCKKPCELYGLGGYSVKCPECNAKNAARQREARARKKREAAQ